MAAVELDAWPSSETSLPRKVFLSLSRSLLWNLCSEVSDPDFGVFKKAGVWEFLGELMKEEAPVGELDMLDPLDCGVPIPLRVLGQLG